MTPFNLPSSRSWFGGWVVFFLLLGPGCGKDPSPVRPRIESDPERERVETNAAWDRIDLWMRKNAPAAFAALNPPASLEEVQTTERALGRAFPEALRASLFRHNGQNTSFPGVFPDGLAFLSTRQISEEWTFRTNFLRRLLRDRDDFKGWRDNIVKGVIFVEGPVKARIANPSWIPVADSNGDIFWFIDDDPAPGGTPGQLIKVDPEGCTWRLEGNSFSSGLQSYAADLDDGLYSWDQRLGCIVRKNPRLVPKGVPDYLK